MQSCRYTFLSTVRPDRARNGLEIPRQEIATHANSLFSNLALALALYLTPLNTLLTLLDQYPVFEFLLECENVKAQELTIKAPAAALAMNPITVAFYGRLREFFDSNNMTIEKL
uniref:Uncharacterized protein n=1 Tax=Romanomermis culicivorax TaxID=13658 RepID=A0A915HT73_ROMCU